MLPKGTALERPKRLNFGTEGFLGMADVMSMSPKSAASKFNGGHFRNLNIHLPLVGVGITLKLSMLG